MRGIDRVSSIDSGGIFYALVSFGAGRPFSARRGGRGRDGRRAVSLGRAWRPALPGSR